MICFHGTDANAARSILQIGFYPDCWFAIRLRDAIAYGGLHIFEVAFNDPPEGWWQFHVPIAIELKRVLQHYTIFKRMS